MRNVVVVGAVIILALSLMITGTILAQDGDDDSSATTAWLGISVTETDEGVVVKRVTTGSPAAAGGVQVGDVVVSIDEQAIESAGDLTEAVQAHAPGDTISLTVMRDDDERTLEIELGSSPVRQRGDEITADTDPLVAAERVLRVDLDAVDEGYQVLAGRARSDDGLVVGDVITAVNETPVADIDWATLLTELADQDDPALALTVLRDGEEVTVEIDRIGGLRGREPWGGSPGDFGRDRFGGRDGNNSGVDPSRAAPHTVSPNMTCADCHQTAPEAAQPAPEGSTPDATTT